MTSRKKRKPRRPQEVKKKTSKKSRKQSRRRSKRGSDDSSSISPPPKKLSKQTKKLISAIQDHVLPLLESKSKQSEELISKNRILFALNRAAQRSLKRENVFGGLNQLKVEANEADKIIAEFLDRELGRDSGQGAQMSLVAPKCALCGAICPKCEDSSPKKKCKRKPGSRSSVSWGEAEVMDFETSDTDKPGAGFYPDPDSDSDDDEENDDSKRKEVAFDLKDFKDIKKSSPKEEAKSSKK